MAMMLGKETTMTSYIKEYKNEEASYDTLHLKEVLVGDTSKMVLANESIITKYEKCLEQYVTTYTFSQQEERKYFYNPKLLSFDLYDTTELWFMLLRLNEMYSTTQFNINPIKIYTTNVVGAIEAILDTEKEIIGANTDEIIANTTGVIVQT